MPWKPVALTCDRSVGVCFRYVRVHTNALAVACPTEPSSSLMACQHRYSPGINIASESLDPFVA